MTPSIWQLLIVLVIVLLLFGRGKIPQLMGDMAKGIKSFKKGMSDEDKKENYLELPLKHYQLLLINNQSLDLKLKISEVYKWEEDQLIILWK